VEKKKLDTVVKLALGVFIGSFVLIGLGMFLSRPDRSIPRTALAPRRAMMIYIFTEPGWTEAEVLHQYLTAVTSGDQTGWEKFEKAVRGSYRLDDREEGRIGPIVSRETAGTRCLRESAVQ